MEIVNLVATAEVSQPIPLVRLANQKQFLYDRAIYHCAYLKDKKTSAKVAIFSSGKMICIGARRLEDAKRSLAYAQKRLVDLGIIRPIKIVVRIQNIVATGDIGAPIDVERLATKLPNVIYEPEQFPGAIFHAKELQGASVLIFASGKVVFAGLKNRALLEKGKQILLDLSKQLNT